MATLKICLIERREMNEHSRLVPGDHLDDPEVRAGYDEARRAIELGAVIRQLRLDTGLSQEELAQRAGMTQPALSRLERGGTVPTLAVLDRVANALQATLTISLTRAA
jgi:HTH-type transcriptional regulator / antitoxin HipB